MHVIKTFLKDFFHLIFPACCLGCGEVLLSAENMICIKCMAKMPKHEARFNTQYLKGERFYNLNYLGHIMVYLKFVKKGITQELLHQIKYKSKPELGTLLGFWFAKDILEAINSNEMFDIIIPVPLHKDKLKKRGYNQSDYLAKGLSEGLNVPWSNSLLTKEVNNESQTRKSRLSRLENVHGVYSIIDKRGVEGKHILLVDDVITTGATIESCARVIRDAGCSSLSIATLAIAN